MQKGFVQFIVLGVVALVIVAAGAFYLQGKEDFLHLGKQSTSNENKTIPTEIAGIPIYPGAVFLGKKLEKVCQNQIPESCQPAITYTFQVTNTDKDTDTDKDKIVNWYNNDESKQGWKVGGGGGCPAPAICFSGIRKEGDSRKFQMDVYYGEDPDKPLNKIDIRFAKFTAPIENWKTYTDKNYGFSLKYPPDFSLLEDATEPSRGRIITALRLEGKENGNHPVINFGITKTDMVAENWISSNNLCPLYLYESGFKCTDLNDPTRNFIQFSTLDKQWPTRETIFKRLGVLFDVSLLNSIVNKPLSDEDVFIYHTIMSTFQAPSIKSITYNKDCSIKVTLSTDKTITTINPPAFRKGCSFTGQPLFDPQISADGKYGAFELWMTEKSQSLGEGTDNSVFVYFADQNDWIKAYSFGAASVENMTFSKDNNNNLELTVGIPGTTDNKTIVLWGIADNFDKVVDPQTKEVKYSDEFPIKYVIYDEN
ncbi:hypothetical protein A3A14_01125 [Candidatus Daviesbacteria bacterium RIFCSPLOWO2_01_FULL_43_38]|uniref:Uncharacterized protein n=1 Tax=Candidatus Daviesbacteria bacterium RIFCSPHIGHO2_12_FULL_43_11 TaxID=1797780 RepID=A0A1F5K3C2_9BACT|nr:MAG: hypothetical protein A2874_01150 [Candidatus Daviesbacteria bacterium RIFCSPHIGHO2_01_FULL_43_17]OGE35201.1 MAG: hypothetical protein A3E45_02870 [Candidatus Daviesbacteria bacterium RIFCSPHIGHO2_12_FULL_43_11]OGE63378.1 MAG: hypothetical protein A3A14_01125 [Candidatus Daviesbacteria bacterium RIFCSPLOWO2_01_FULL_43_38]OGE70837.1 MAG: hypothetical protein A3J21_00475 [Candidatus Daviesbacteria bacterium RIFCSPLOWO2_02_FULL_43_11]